MKYSKSTGGPWAKGSDITSGTKAKIVSETVHSESRYKDEKTGASKFQDVAKVRFEGKEEALNTNLNRATILWADRCIRGREQRLDWQSAHCRNRKSGRRW
jgi:hypothetical protein